MRQGYLLIKDIQVDYLNMAANWFVTGVPMTAIAGYVHALERKLNAGGVSLHFDAFTPIIHDSEVHTSGIRMSRSNYGEKQQASPVNLGERRTFGRLSLSLVLSVVADNKPSFSGFGLAAQQARTFTLTESNLDFISTLVSTLRLNGGVCILDDEFRPSAHSNQIEYVPNGDPRVLETAFRSLSSGYLLRSRIDLIEHYREAYQLDTLDAFLHALMLHPQKASGAGGAADDYLGLNGEPRLKESQPVLRRRAQKGWVIPMAAGFVSREVPKPGRIPEYAHVYAEPVCSLVECISSKRVLNKAFSQTDHASTLSTSVPFWAYRVSPDSGMYTLSQINA